MRSCILMKVDRPFIELPLKFHRLYVSLAAMKTGFLASCRLVIGLDGCFLKGHFKGQLLATIGRDGNNNMYLLAIVVVEVEVNDSWTWLLKL